MIELSNVQFDIIKAISQGSDSASAAAKKTNLSLPYTLSQIQLLEAYNVIETIKKQPKKGPGKPRKKYTVEKSSLKIELVSKHLVERKQITDIHIQNYIQLILSTPTKKQTAISEYYWANFKNIKDVISFAFIEHSEKKVEILAFTKGENLDRLRHHISNFTSSDGVVVACWIHEINEFLDGINRKDHYYETIKSKAKPIIDPEGLFEQVYNE